MRHQGGLRTAGLRLALAALACTPAVARAVDDPGCGRLAVPMQAGVVLYRLPRGFLRAGSDSVTFGRIPLRRDLDYVLDPTRGELRLLRDPLPGDTLWVQACWLIAPPPLQLSYYDWRPAVAAVGDTTRPDSAVARLRPATARSVSAAPGGTSLVVSGNKSLAVEFGSNQDAFVRQSLDLSVNGSLGPGVQLTGVLSDRNVPLGAGGTTQGLQSFDRVLVELSAPQGTAALGDVSLELGRGEFARLERRLQGMRAEGGVGAARAVVAAANAQGEYHRLQILGVEGRQGPYLLTDGNDVPGVSVVPSSEGVTVDGVRMTRGESADYSIDYDRGQITFSNRRPISSDSRITVDYQFSVTRYRRNLAAAGATWDGPHSFGYTQWILENDDRGHPITVTLSPDDRVALAAAGDSAAIGSGVTPGIGDYDTVRVASGETVFAFAGTDSGKFDVQFTAASGTGADYVDSTAVAGRVTYHWVGAAAGRFRVGRRLPLPEAHQLLAVGGGARAGALSVEAEGAVSRLDPNTFSALDDSRHAGEALRGSADLQGALPGGWARAGVAVRGRDVSARFEPFMRLAAPFAQEQWGLPPGGDLEHPRLVEASAFLEPRRGGRLTLGLGHLDTPEGFSALRRTAEWSMDGRLATRALWEQSDGTLAGKQFRDGGRDHTRLEARARLPWLEPALRVESDERRSPSDSARVGDRFREAAAELAAPAGFTWRANAGLTLRRNARILGDRFVDASDARTVRAGVESPAERALGLALDLQRRSLLPLADPQRTTSDLASLRLRGDERKRGVRGRFNLEITSEGQSRYTRALVFVGGGKGGYDANGNFVGLGGDYDLTVVLSPDLERIARAATSASAEWLAPATSRWHGSHAEFRYEGEARRRGELLGHDVLVSPGMAHDDTALARATLSQRFEGELLPEAKVGSVRLLAERRITADRSFANFAQIQDQRTLSARWRSRPGSRASGEIEARWSRRDAEQELVGANPYQRTLTDRGATAQVGWTPDDRLRLGGALEATWTKAEDQPLATRTLRLGPDRAFINGASPVNLLPTLDPAGAPRWEAQSRVDYRVRESSTFGLSVLVQDRPERPTVVTGRAELRAFF